MQRKKSFSRILIAVSGGPDSMFLASLMIRMYKAQKIPLSHLFLVHCNHKVRSESDQEEQFIRNYFKDQQLIVIKKPKQVPTTEAGLRAWRYQERRNIMEKKNINQIYLGHHFDDRVETTFLNLLRGCGREGFLGIKQKEPHHLLGGKIVNRPLLAYHKKEILKRCKKFAIPYVIDQSNYESTTSLRNKIRIEYLPGLYQQIGFETTLRKIYALYEQQTPENLLSDIAKSPFRRVKEAKILTIPRRDLDAQQLVTILKQLHMSGGITQKTIEEFLKFIHTSASGRKRIHTLTIMIAHDKLYFFVGPERFREKTVDKQRKIDTSTTKRFPLSGDRIHGKSRSKYCLNHKIPLFWRNFIPLIVHNGIHIRSLVPNIRSDYYTPEF